MGRLIGIDYGRKRVGIAHSDPMQIIASPLCTLPPAESLDFLQKYVRENPVEAIVVGQPHHTYDVDAPVEIETDIRAFIARLAEVLPGIPVERYDERFTSKMAAHDLFCSGVSRSKRREKGNLDMTSAAIILRDYIAARKNG